MTEELKAKGAKVLSDSTEINVTIFSPSRTLFYSRQAALDNNGPFLRVTFDRILVST